MNWFDRLRCRVGMHDWVDSGLTYLLPWYRIEDCRRCKATTQILQSVRMGTR